jgi:hypothetical protein
MKPLVATFAPLLTALLTTPTVASADPPKAPDEAPEPPDEAPPGKSVPPALFGTTGTRALGLLFDIGAANSGLPTRPLGFGSTLALDSFVVGHLSVGGEFGFDYSGADGSFYDVGGGPRVGYAIALGSKLALWPTLIFTYEAGVVPVPSTNASVSLQDVRFGAAMPLVMTLGGQTAIELGPVASNDLWRSEGGQSAPQVALIGLRAGIVGWF